MTDKDYRTLCALFVLIKPCLKIAGKTFSYERQRLKRLNLRSLIRNVGKLVEEEFKLDHCNEQVINLGCFKNDLESMKRNLHSVLIKEECKRNYKFLKEKEKTAKIKKS